MRLKLLNVSLILTSLLVIGVIDMNLRVLLSTVPFLTLAVVAIRAHRPGRG